MKTLLNAFSEQGGQTLSYLAERLSKDGSAINVDFHQWITFTFSEILGNVVFGPNLLRDCPDLLENYSRMTSPHLLLPPPLAKWMAPEAVRNRELCVTALTRFFTDPVMSESASEWVMEHARQQREVGASWDSVARVALGLFDVFVETHLSV